MNKENRKTISTAISQIEHVKSELEQFQGSDTATLDMLRLALAGNAEHRDKDLRGTLLGLLESAHSDLESAQGEEQDKFDNMSEGLQQSENGQKLEENANDLEEAVNSLDEAEGLDLWAALTSGESPAPGTDRIDAHSDDLDLDEIIETLQNAIDKAQEAVDR